MDIGPFLRDNRKSTYPMARHDGGNDSSRNMPAVYTYRSNYKFDYEYHHLYSISNHEPYLLSFCVISINRELMNTIQFVSIIRTPYEVSKLPAIKRRQSTTNSERKMYESDRTWTYQCCMLVRSGCL